MAIDQFWAKSGGAWQQGKALFVKSGGAWSRVKTAYVKVAGAWQQVYGDAQAFVSATGTFVSSGNWTFAWSIHVNGSEAGGGYGQQIVVERSDGSGVVDTINNAGSSGSRAIAALETVGYRAKLYNKGGVLVDEVEFFVDGVIV